MRYTGWDDGQLRVSQNGRTLRIGEKPFFWLGDTAWLLFQKLQVEEARQYLEDRARKGYTVIQCVFWHPQNDHDFASDLPAGIHDQKYWERCDKILEIAQDLGLVMAVLPCWGSVITSGSLNLQEYLAYLDALEKKVRSYSNLVWLLGGDVRGSAALEFYRSAGEFLKERNPGRLIGFHPFGRTSSSRWFHKEPWLDFNMFQSGHRRYGQTFLKAWDDMDGEPNYGEDNWRYVREDLLLRPAKPTVDGEPSYEDIPQGLHDDSQPRWQPADVRRYAYWSVFQGAMGHTYGDNAVMQFYHGTEKGAYGVSEPWTSALNRPGASQMPILRRLMESIRFETGCSREDLLLSPQGERHDHVSVFAGSGFLLAYTAAERPLRVSLTPFEGQQITACWMNPETGRFTEEQNVTGQRKLETVPPQRESGRDWVLLVRAKSLSASANPNREGTSL